VPEFQRLEIPTVETSTDALRGQVLTVDRFGNLVTNLDRRTFDAFAKQAPIQILAAGIPVARPVSTYSEIAAGEVCALFGSSDHLELAAHAASAADRLGLGRHAAVEVRRGDIQ
jgi:S-adenosylmethionine hydrolase